ncbi:MAG: hypothetical protein MPN21_19370 [Thermoanaerobaculia bacterium]|nr:hypothetical protein [Thermoanaerobaculia bacterium]
MTDQSQPPQGAQAKGPPPRAAVLERLLDAETDLDEAFDRLARKAPDSPEAGTFTKGAVRAVVPGEALASADSSLAVLLTSVLSEYEEIENVLEGLREVEGIHTIDDQVVVISEEQLADPQGLHDALESLRSETKRFEFLFASAKAALDRLDVFDLSQRPTRELVMILKSEGNLGRLQALVEFLRHLQDAAESFEALALPQPHIRDYLRQLYTMRDWSEMGRLIGVLSGAVSSLYVGDGTVGRVSIHEASGAIGPEQPAARPEDDEQSSETP